MGVRPSLPVLYVILVGCVGNATAPAESTAQAVRVEEAEEAAEEPVTSTEEAPEVDGTEPGEEAAEPLAFPPRDIFGRSSRDLSTEFGPSAELGYGWLSYGDSIAAPGRWIAVRFGDGLASHIRYALQRSMTCRDASTSLGFPNAGPALRRPETCQWPGISERHRLGVFTSSDGSRIVTGVYTPETGIFEVRLAAE